METLQQAFDKVVRSLPYQYIENLIDRKLKDRGIKVSRRERNKLRAFLESGRLDSFQCRSWVWWKNREITIHLTEEDINNFERQSRLFLENDLPTIIHETKDNVANEIFSRRRRHWRKVDKKGQRELTKFRRRLYQRWAKGLENLRIMLGIAQEFGDTTNTSLRNAAHDGFHYRIEVLTALHARACQVTGEIISLLESGFADGAMARWRTLHEIAITSLFIHQCGEDLAERYVTHQIVESRRAAHEYKRYQDRLGFDPIDQAELDSLEDSYQKFDSSIWEEFREPYGWAAEHLSIRKLSFADIERYVKTDHFRAYYRLASHNVHANPRGAFFKLGLIAESELLLAGPSNAGLADPGQCTALSLLNASVALGTLQPTLDSLVGLKVLTILQDEVVKAFIEAHEQLESEEIETKE
jgi:hypothetical protein